MDFSELDKFLAENVQPSRPLSQADIDYYGEGAFLDPLDANTKEFQETHKHFRKEQENFTYKTGNNFYPNDILNGFRVEDHLKFNSFNVNEETQSTAAEATESASYIMHLAREYAEELFEIQKIEEEIKIAKKVLKQKYELQGLDVSAFNSELKRYQKEREMDTVEKFARAAFQHLFKTDDMFSKHAELMKMRAEEAKEVLKNPELHDKNVLEGVKKYTTHLKDMRLGHGATPAMMELQHESRMASNGSEHSFEKVQKLSEQVQQQLDNRNSLRMDTPDMSQISSPTYHEDSHDLNARKLEVQDITEEEEFAKKGISKEMLLMTSDEMQELTGEKLWDLLRYARKHTASAQYGYFRNEITDRIYDVLDQRIIKTHKQFKDLYEAEMDYSRTNDREYRAEQEQKFLDLLAANGLGDWNSQTRAICYGFWGYHSEDAPMTLSQLSENFKSLGYESVAELTVDDCYNAVRDYGLKLYKTWKNDDVNSEAFKEKVYSKMAIVNKQMFNACDNYMTVSHFLFNTTFDEYTGGRDYENYTTFQRWYGKPLQGEQDKEFVMTIHRMQPMYDTWFKSKTLPELAEGFGWKTKEDIELGMLQLRLKFEEFCDRFTNDQIKLKAWFTKGIPVPADVETLWQNIDQTMLRVTRTLLEVSKAQWLNKDVVSKLKFVPCVDTQTAEYEYTLEWNDLHKYHVRFNMEPVKILDLDPDKVPEDFEIPRHWFCCKDVEEDGVVEILTWLERNKTNANVKAALRLL